MSSRRIPNPDKLYFKIGEVAELLGVKPHVLRYWESEFAALKPSKTRGSHRLYSRKDIELVSTIRRLLHDEGYTIPGARKKLAAARRADRPPVHEALEKADRRELSLRAELIHLREVLTGLLDELSDLSEADDAPGHTARVDKVVPSSVPVRKPSRRP